MELLEAGDGTATVRMPVGPAMVNGHAIAHGGYVFLLADTAFACACNSRGPVTVAAGADITFMAPAREGDVLVATPRSGSATAAAASSTSPSARRRDRGGVPRPKPLDHRLAAVRRAAAGIDAALPRTRCG